jgi:hypothetical protein
MCSLTLKKFINLITLNCLEVLLHVTKAINGTGSKPARRTPFVSWLLITLHSTLDCNGEAQTSPCCYKRKVKTRIIIRNKVIK